MKVKIITEKHYDVLENKINEFIKHKKVTDIRLSIHKSNFVALVLYS